MVYSCFLSILSVSFLATTSLCASGRDGTAPPLNESSDITSSSPRLPRKALEELLGASPNDKVVRSTAQRMQVEKKGGKEKKRKDSRSPQVEVIGAAQLAKEAAKERRRRTMSQTSVSIPNQNVHEVLKERAREEDKHVTTFSSSSSESPGSSSPKEERRGERLFGGILSAFRKLNVALDDAGKSSVEDIVIGGPSINTTLTHGKAFDRLQTSQEIECLITRVSAMQKILEAHRTPGGKLVDPEKYDLVLKGDFAQLNNMCVEGLKYCDLNAESKDDEVSMYIQNLNRFSDSIGHEILWAMGSEDTLLDTKLRDAREEVEEATVTCALASPRITHPLRRRRGSTVGQNSKDKINLVQDEPADKVEQVNTSAAGGPPTE